MQFSTSVALALLSALPSSLATAVSCSNTQLSCHGSSTNTCCYNSPSGLFQQVQFWDTNPVTGPDNSWTIHGLWPNKCDGTYNQNCDTSRAYKNITQLLDNAGQSSTVSYMQEYWVSNDESPEAFWDHEWVTHGTCVSTLAKSCYTNYKPGDEAVDFFTRTVSLFKSLPTYTWLANAGITPDDDNEYYLSDMNDALENAFGAPVILLCENTNVVYEIYYGFNVQGSLQSGTFEPTSQTGSKTNCPSTVMYPTKS